MVSDEYRYSCNVRIPARVAANSFLRPAMGIHSNSGESYYLTGDAPGVVADDIGDCSPAGSAGILERRCEAVATTDGNVHRNWRGGVASLAHVLRSNQIVECVRSSNVYGTGSGVDRSH